MIQDSGRILPGYISFSSHIRLVLVAIHEYACGFFFYLIPTEATEQNCYFISYGLCEDEYHIKMVRRPTIRNKV